MYDSLHRDHEIDRAIHDEITDIMNNRDVDDEPIDDQDSINEFKNDLMKGLVADFTDKYSPEDNIIVINLLLAKYKSEDAKKLLFKSITSMINKKRGLDIKKPTLKMIKALFDVVVNELDAIKQTIPHDQTNEEDVPSPINEEDVPNPIKETQVTKNL